MLSHRQTIICDEVRREDNGKLLVIGMYTGGLTIPQLPFFMPGGLTFMSIWDADRPGSTDLKFRLQYLESGKSLIEARGNINILAPGQAYVPIRLAPLQIQNFGAYTLSIDVEGQRDPVTVDFVIQLNAPQMMVPPQAPR